MESSFEPNCCVSASSLATAPPLVVSCHRVPSNSTVVHETFRRAECERCSSHPAHALPCVQVRRGGSRSHHRHLALVILRRRLPLLSPKHPTLALHIPSQVRLYLLRPHPLPCLRLPGRRRSSRRRRPALQKRFWETSNKHKGT